LGIPPESHCGVGLAAAGTGSTLVTSIPPALPVPSTALATPPVPPVIMGPRERLEEIVSEIGFNATLDLLAAGEQVAA
jgi:hypothetical protein